MGSTLTALFVLVSIVVGLYLRLRRQQRQRREMEEVAEARRRCALCDSSELTHVSPEDDYMCQQCGFRSEWERESTLEDPLDRVRAAQQARVVLDDVLEQLQHHRQSNRPRKSMEWKVRTEPSADRAPGRLFDDLARADRLLDEAGADLDSLPALPDPDELAETHLDERLSHATRIRDRRHEELLEQASEDND